MAEIKLTGINKIYPNGFQAVHDVNLHIQDGEFMIMVGPSGCAKSTILRMIAGLEEISSGTLEIGGRVVNDVPPKDRDIAMVFQSYALYPHMTVRDNMSFGLRLRKMPDAEIQQRVMEAARILGLEPLLDRLPKAMSGGQRQRVAMGRAIVREPQSFLMDEPLSNLDAKLRVQMRTEIAKLHARLQTTTVYVTHDQVEAMTLGQRICILRRGIVQQVDTPFQVYANPNNIFVGGFIGSPGMNFMMGHLMLHQGVVHLQLGEHHIPLPASVTSRLVSSTDLNGRGVVVGIRPEHLEPAVAGSTHALPVNVELVEAMGAEAYAYFTMNIPTPDLSELSDTQAVASTFVARLDPSRTSASAGSDLWLRMKLDHIHLFDSESQLSLLAPIGEDELRALSGNPTVTVPNEWVTTETQTMQPAFAPRPVLAGYATPPGTMVTAVTDMNGTLQPAAMQQMQPAQPVIHLHQTIAATPTHAGPAQPPAPGHEHMTELPTAQVPTMGTGQSTPLMPRPSFGRQPVEGVDPALATPRLTETSDGALAMPNLRLGANSASKLFQGRPLFGSGRTSADTSAD